MQKTTRSIHSRPDLYCGGQTDRTSLDKQVTSRSQLPCTFLLQLSTPMMLSSFLPYALQHPAGYCLRFFTNVAGARARCLEVLGVNTQAHRAR